MTPLDNARLDFEDHANQLQRALGRGGAPVDLDIARAELIAAEAALQALDVLLRKAATWLR